MSWIQKLSETYDNCENMVGVDTGENSVPLLPICHTTQKAHIEIIIDGNGNFRGARPVSKDKARTIIPCTESSSGRTSGEAPHPLCDKLQYVALDYVKHGGNKKHYHASYLAQLERWCESSFSHPKAVAVLKYVKKGNVIGDLINHKVLIANKGELLRRWDGDKKEKPAIFALFQNQEWQADSFIRWAIEVPDVLESATWKDKSLWQSWTQYYLDLKKDKKGFCYVKGEHLVIADQHPKKIRNDGDGAKLIASGKSTDKDGVEKVDDGCGFTFLGRFQSADQALSVSLDVSQKAHLALRWLISIQGYSQDDLAIVAWATSGARVPNVLKSSLSIIDADDLTPDVPQTANTAQQLAVKLKKKIAGYGKEIGDTTDVVVMGLDSATPGRVSIIYYRLLTGADFLNRINNWHEKCAWLHSYASIDAPNEKSGRKNVYFIGAPAPLDIAEAAYATNREGEFKVDEKIRKSTIERILPCIVDGQQIPRDIVDSAVRKASNRIALEKWQWEKTLSIACALYKKLNEKENFEMPLDETKDTRDYLYGRLLAIADTLEERALYKGDQKRATNAARYMQQFSQRPLQTWKQIHDSLNPYMIRLGGVKANFYKNLIAEVTNINPDALVSNKPLTGEYLLGYYCQRQKLREKFNADKPVQETENDDKNSDE